MWLGVIAPFLVVNQTNLRREINFMNTTNKTVLIVVISFVVVLLLLFSGGAMLTGGMMGNGTMGGIGWMWIPIILMLGLGALLVWAIFGQKK